MPTAVLGIPRLHTNGRRRRRRRLCSSYKRRIEQVPKAAGESVGDRSISLDSVDRDRKRSLSPLGNSSFPLFQEEATFPEESSPITQTAERSVLVTIIIIVYPCASCSLRQDHRRVITCRSSRTEMIGIAVAITNSCSRDVTREKYPVSCIY